MSQAVVPAEPFLPAVLASGAKASLVVEFLDGSTAELSWPSDLDLFSEGVTPYGWAFVPQQKARDFFIRRGHGFSATSHSGCTRGRLPLADELDSLVAKRGNQSGSRECEPGLVGPIGEGGFLHWCDVSGLLSVRVEGPTDFAQQIYDDLMISNVHLAGSTG